MRPFFPYFGSAWGKSRRFPPPQHDRVIEPFGGGAGYACFYDCRRVDLIDRDPIVAGVWRYLMGVRPAEIMALPDMPAVGDNVDNYSLPQEAKWLIGFWLNRGSATPEKSRTAYSARTDGSQLNWGQRAKERIAAQLPALEDWRIVEGSYDQAPDVEATWFVDAPYVDKGRYYRFPFADFDRLASWCRTRTGLLIACEAEGASWLPFGRLGSFKSSLGHSSEVAYIQGDGRALFARAAA